MASGGGSANGGKSGGRHWAFLRRVIPWAAGLGVVGFILAGMRSGPAMVEAGVVSRGPLTVTVLEEGKTRIRHRYLISAPVSGLLERPELRAGAVLKAGETVLCAIVPGPSNLLDVRTRAQAEARVSAAEAAARQAEEEVERARAALDLARTENARAARLLKERAVSAQEADAAANREVVAERSLRAAEFGRKVADFEVEQARAALLAADAQQSGPDGPGRIVITSPVDGVILNVMEESARMVAAGTAIMEIGDPADLEAEIELLSADAVAVTPGAEVVIEQWGGGQPFRGRVALVEPGGFTKISSLGVEEQRVKVRVDFVDPPPEARALGDRYRVEARIVTWHGDDVLQVPVAALFRRGNDWMTFRVEGGRARLVRVGVDRNNGQAASVSGGLGEGDQVILHPPDTLEDGSAVSVIR